MKKTRKLLYAIESNVLDEHHLKKLRVNKGMPRQEEEKKSLAAENFLDGRTTKIKVISTKIAH